MTYSVTDSIKEAIGQVASNHDLSAYAVMDLYSTVTDYVLDYLTDQQFENSADDSEFEVALEGDLSVEQAIVLDLFGDDEPVDHGDPATLVANAEEFIDGCERADFLAEQGYGEHFLTGLRDRLTYIIDNG